MKLIIPKQIVSSYKRDCDQSDFKDEFDELSSNLIKLGVRHTFDIVEDECTLIINDQKCTLDEYVMNELLSILSEYFDFSIRYMQLGGAGCQFAMELAWN